MNEENVCKLLSDEEVNNFIDELLKLPVEKNNNCLSTYGSVNVDDLITVAKEIRKVPTYDVVLRENMRLKQKLQQKEDVINKIIDIKYNFQNENSSLIFEYDTLLKFMNDLQDIFILKIRSDK